MGRMMSICLTWFPIGGLGEPNYTIIWLNLQECWDFTWRMFDCEELVGDKFLNLLFGLVLLNCAYF